MSVDSLLTRLTAQQFKQFLGNPGSLHQHATEDETYFEAAQTIPAHAEIQSLIIDEHTLGMFTQAGSEKTVFALALIEGYNSLPSSNSGETFAYLQPEAVKTITADLQVFSETTLRDLFGLDLNRDLATWVEEYEYEDEAALLAYQQKAYQNILRFYEQAATAGDAVIIQYE